MSDAEIESQLLNALRSAILADTRRSLNDPVNRFTEASQEDPCKCYNNMTVAVRVVGGDRRRTKDYVDLIREHMTDPGRTCGHVWHYKQIRKAAHEYRKPREIVGEF
jgi:hypothetical protein